MNKKNLLLVVPALFAVGATKAQAVTIGVKSVQTVSNSFGAITDIGSLMIFAFNLMYYLGLSLVAIAILAGLVLIIYKLFWADGEDAMKTVQSGFTKLVLVVIVGLLLMSASFLFEFVGQLLGFAPNQGAKVMTAPQTSVGS